MLPIPTQAVPRSHKEIEGRLPIITHGGIEAHIMVVKQIGDTTNHDARLMMKKRTLAMAKAREDGVGLGIDLRVKLDAKDKDIVTIQIPGMKGIPIEPLSDGSYSVLNQRFPDLRKAAVSVMEKYELHHTASIAATASQAASYGMRR
jgi:hypothetical protein